MHIQEVSVLPTLNSLQEEGTFYRKYANGTLYFWEHVGEFLLKEDGSILYRKANGVAEEVFQNYLTGSILPAAHAYAGNLVLHGSCIRVKNKVIGFLGYSGMGKSTTAKAMILRGHQLISDDNIMVCNYQPIKVLVGENHMRLWKDALNHFDLETDGKSKVHPDFNKHINIIDKHSAEKEVPLDALFILSYGRKHEILPLTGAQAVTELVSQCKGLLFLKEDREVQHFMQCSALARQIPVYLLKRRRGLQNLDKLCAKLEEFLAQ